MQPVVQLSFIRLILISSQVDGEAQGSDDAIKEFIQHIGKGPSMAKVTKVDHKDIDSKSGETGFGVR